MSAISAASVKALRDKTGAGMMDCKKALGECNGDEEKAVAWLREKGLSMRVMVGGAVVTEAFARSIGADAYAADAVDAVRQAKALIGESA